MRFVPKPSFTMHKGSICGLKKTSRVSQVLLLGLGLNAQCVLLVKTHEFLYMWSVHIPDIRYVSFFKDFIYFKREGKGRRKRGREISIRGCLLHSLSWRPGLQPSMCPPWGWNLHPFLHSLVLTLLLHTNQGITYISKKCTNRKCPRIRLPMRGKTPLKGGKVWEAALILSFFLVAARRHVIFTLISMWLFPSVLTKPKHVQESWHWLFTLH